MTGSDSWDTCRLFLFVGNVKGLLFLRVLCCDGGSEVNLASPLACVRKTQAAGNYRFEGTTSPPFSTRYFVICSRGGAAAAAGWVVISGAIVRPPMTLA